MKQLILIILSIIFLLLNSCAKRKLKVYNSDKVLKMMNPRESFITINSVGFEWREINDTSVNAINIYRGEKSQNLSEFIRIKTINNHYATRFVDTSVLPKHNYSYVFSVISEGKESSFSPRLDIVMPSPLDAILLIEAQKMDNKVIRISWIAHENTNVSSYILERRIDGGKWRFLSIVQGRLMTEYIDTFIQEGHSYEYRIIAISYAKIRSYPSKATQLIKIPIKR